MRRLLLLMAAGTMACASAPAAPPTSPTTTEGSEEGTFACEDIDGLCDDAPVDGAPAGEAQGPPPCDAIDSCRERCTRGHASSCLEAHRLGKSVLGEKLAAELLERACVLGSAPACRLSGDVAARDPRTSEPESSEK